MPCLTDGHLSICIPDRLTTRIIRRCPMEKRRRRIVGHDLGSWYGIRWTCCGCGDSWMEGELTERPFKRGWRKTVIAAAKADWATALPLAEYTRVSRERLQREMAS